MSEEPADFIKPHPIPEPRSCGKMTQGMGVQSPVWWQPGFRTQPVENLDQVPALQRPIVGVHKQEVFRSERPAGAQVLFKCPGCSRSDEHHAVFPPLPRSNEQAPISRTPVFNKETQDLRSPETRVGHDQDQHPIATALEANATVR